MFLLVLLCSLFLINMLWFILLRNLKQTCFKKTVDLLLIVDAIASYNCLPNHLHILTMGHWLRDLWKDDWCLFTTACDVVYNAYLPLVILILGQGCLFTSWSLLVLFHCFINKLANYYLWKKIQLTYKISCTLWVFLILGPCQWALNHCKNLSNM